MLLVPGAVLDPGRHWNYEAGYATLRAEFLHWTVGRDSRALIRNNGLAPILIRDGIIYQYAPLDALCFTQCEWNRWGFGVEIESMDGTVDDAELEALHWLTQWAITTGLIRPEWYNGPRLPIGTVFFGITGHRNLIHRACDMHSDGYDDWLYEWILTPYGGGGGGDDMYSDEDRARDYATALRVAAIIDQCEGGPGLRKIRWYLPDGTPVEDTIGIADDGSVFTTSGLGDGHYFISGPRAHPDPERPRSREPSRLDQVPVAIVQRGQVRFRTQAAGGPQGGGTGVIEHYWNPADRPGADGSRWGSYML